jgi:hypothetical protein
VVCVGLCPSPGVPYCCTCSHNSSPVHVHGLPLATLFVAYLCALPVPLVDSPQLLLVYLLLLSRVLEFSAHVCMCCFGSS